MQITEVKIGDVLQFGARRYVVSGAAHPNDGFGHSSLYLAPFSGDPQRVADKNLSIEMANL